ncbi:MAG: hypothetical protein IIA88_03170 [Bacteroidetes bacterium]|nr:hypothetical protein [Bacteroidota bacterium]
MKKFTLYTTALFTIFALMFSCKDKVHCPAYRSSGVTTTLDQFNEDGTPIAGRKIKKNEQGLVEKSKREKGGKKRKYKDPRKNYK